MAHSREKHYDADVILLRKSSVDVILTRESSDDVIFMRKSFADVILVRSLSHVFSWIRHFLLSSCACIQNVTSRDMLISRESFDFFYSQLSLASLC